MILRILKITPVANRVKSFKLQKPKGFSFIPGQATDVSVNKPGWINKKKPFTFTSLNEDDYLEFTIKCYPLDEFPNHSGVTEQIHKLKVGDELIIDEPWGTINYQNQGIFIAGGAGITPFIAIFRSLYKNKILKGNKLIYSNKTKADIILEEDLKKMFPNRNDLILTLTQDELDGYEHGRIDENILKKYISSFSQKFYVCGPKPMVEELKGNLHSLGASFESIVFEK